MDENQNLYWNSMVPELTVTDFAASLRFYTVVLGFEVRIQRQQPDFAYLCYGQAQLMIEQFHPQGWNTADLRWPLGRGINFQIEVDDIEAVMARLQQHAVPLYRALRDNHYDTGETTACQRECLVQDPDGYLLRFSQYLE
ncbi:MULTISPECIES: bleomycin resistance protein [Pantoea]|jgi:catechol 2,3-dioxygenase-like lactoylglutathione lyase family enzyme|uniref:Bleomycin resistance protein n=1 Tax=Pantoea vagans TaxID=470934 RepID=A0AAN1TXD6_9GAMM|nr:MULTISPECIES: VOC family protein [Pantoea]ADI78528.1 Probable lactoylglutathione lyase [Pantoea vagans C9-1]AVV39458.1 VOC family protein [Pantoea vagans]MBK5013345.1 VOC family protein [Pantoea sp. S62]TXL79716.1 VOC family protein [Pantoea vagans]